MGGLPTRIAAALAAVRRHLGQAVAVEADEAAQVER
jgi:hypothetical protein